MFINPSGISLIFFSMALLSCVIWFIIRKKRNRVWLPTLRLIKEESNPLPKIQLLPPPWLMFLCFALSALSLFILFLKPSQRQFYDLQSNLDKVHVYIDVSPSTSEYLQDENVRNRLAQVFEQYSQKGNLSFSSSASDEILTFKSITELNDWYLSLQAHRSGLKLGKQIRNRLVAVGPIDQLVIFSDYDRSSWVDFNWRYLEAKMSVSLVPLSGNESARNIYIDGADLISQDNDNQVTWSVRVRRNYNDISSDGIVKVMHNQREVARSNFYIEKGQGYVDIQIYWPWDRWSEGGKNEEILWVLESASANALTIDDTFRTKKKGVKKDLLIVSQPEGEMFLEDSVRHLSIATEVLGFRTVREDVFTDREENWQLPLWIIAAHQEPVEEFCPLSYEGKRIEHNQSGVSTKLPVVWLMPKNLNSSFSNLCWCYSRLIVGNDRHQKMPLYCEELETRDQYISVLQSLGAQQLGGAVGNTLNSLAWHRKRSEIGAEVLAFTIPLKPSKQTGVSYDALPSLTKSLLKHSYILAPEGGAIGQRWPRYIHIDDYREDPLLNKSNVPAGESAMQRMAMTDLPPTFDQGSSVNLRMNHGVQEGEDPRVFIEVVFWILSILALLEGLWILTKTIRTSALRSTSILILVIFFNTDPLEASVKLNLIGYPQARFQGASLARDVSGRTSIMIQTSIENHPVLESKHLSSPWLWVADPSHLEKNSAQLKSGLQRWVKRGGLLIVENVHDSKDLKSIIDLNGGEWRVIPPDHEIMRSFHLLDSLPKCRERVWMGYHYDDRIAVIASPFGFIQGLIDPQRMDACARKLGREQSTRIFINMLMVALATDYKKDQIHLPEILKRLR